MVLMDTSIPGNSISWNNLELSGTAIHMVPSVLRTSGPIWILYPVIPCS